MVPLIDVLEGETLQDGATSVKSYKLERLCRDRKKWKKWHVHEK